MSSSMSEQPNNQTFKQSNPIPHSAPPRNLSRPLRLNLTQEFAVHTPFIGIIFPDQYESDESEKHVVRHGIRIGLHDSAESEYNHQDGSEDEGVVGAQTKNDEETDNKLGKWQGIGKRGYDQVGELFGETLLESGCEIFNSANEFVEAVAEQHQTESNSEQEVSCDLMIGHSSKYLYLRMGSCSN